MGEVIRFVSKSERERIKLIRQARAFYDSVFPPAEPLGAPRDPASPAPPDARRGDGSRA